MSDSGKRALLLYQSLFRSKIIESVKYAGDKRLYQLKMDKATFPESPLLTSQKGGGGHDLNY